MTALIFAPGLSPPCPTVTTRSPGRSPARICIVAVDGSDRDRHPGHGVRSRDEDVVLAVLGQHAAPRHQDRLGEVAGLDAHARERAGAQRAVTVRHLDRHLERAVGAVDDRIHQRDASADGAARLRIERERGLLPDLDARELALREIDAGQHRLEVGDPEAITSRGHGLAELHHAIDDPSGERRRDHALRQLVTRLLQLDGGVAELDLEVVQLLRAQAALVVELLRSIDLALRDLGRELALLDRELGLAVVETGEHRALLGPRALLGQDRRDLALAARHQDRDVASLERRGVLEVGRDLAGLDLGELDRCDRRFLLIALFLAFGLALWAGADWLAVVFLRTRLRPLSGR